MDPTLSAPAKELSAAQLVTLRLEAMKLAVATLPMQYLAMPQGVEVLEQRANDIVRYVLGGVLNAPPPKPKK